MLTVPKIVIPDQFNAATAFLDRNLAEGRGSKTAIYFEGNSYTYAGLSLSPNFPKRRLAKFNALS